MNKYVSAGLVNDAQEGKWVIAYLPTQADGRALLGNLEAQSLEDVIRVVRSNGSERVDFASGGSVEIRANSNGRVHGVSGPVVLFVEGWNDLSDEVREELLTTTATARGGIELIRA